MTNLCDHCRLADKVCPVYSPGVPTYKCVEWRPPEDILIDEFSRLATQNAGIVYR